MNIFVLQKSTEEERLKRRFSLGSADCSREVWKPTLIIQVFCPQRHF